MVLLPAPHACVGQGELNVPVSQPSQNDYKPSDVDQEWMETSYDKGLIGGTKCVDLVQVQCCNTCDQEVVVQVSCKGLAK
jgi:hypothetical protein